MRRPFFDPELEELAALAASLDATMAEGADTIDQFGSRFTTPTYYSYRPQGYGPQTTGVPQVSPTLPPFLGGSAAGGSGSGYSGGSVGGYGTAENNGLVTNIANQNPHNWKVSPTWWAVALLIIGLMLLKVVHWRSLEEGSAMIRVGAGEAEAREEA